MFDPIKFSTKVSEAIRSTAAVAGPGRVGQMLSHVIAPTIGGDRVRHRMLDVLFNFGIPFNRWLGMRIQHFEPDQVTIVSPDTVLRRNHVSTAHACAQALLGEYASGLVVAQHYPTEKYRIIIGRLEIDYKKAGRGTLTGTALAPESWPEEGGDEFWVPMETLIVNEAGDEISTCRTKWQVKSWERISADKVTRAGKATS